MTARGFRAFALVLVAMLVPVTARSQSAEPVALDMDQVEWVEIVPGVDFANVYGVFTEGGHGKESSKVNVESTGFGLYIVKNIIEAHQGKVWAESEGKDKGSRFIVELPAS